MRSGGRLSRGLGQLGSQFFHIVERLLDQVFYRGWQ